MREFEENQKYEAEERGVAGLTKSKGQWCFVFGSKVREGVKVDTKMIRNVLDHILFRQDPIKKFVDFPNVLDQIKSDDAVFETASNNCL